MIKGFTLTRIDYNLAKSFSPPFRAPFKLQQSVYFQTGADRGFLTKYISQTCTRSPLPLPLLPPRSGGRGRSLQGFDSLTQVCHVTAPLSCLPCLSGLAVKGTARLTVHSHSSLPSGPLRAAHPKLHSGTMPPLDDTDMDIIRMITLIYEASFLTKAHSAWQLLTTFTTNTKCTNATDALSQA